MHQTKNLEDGYMGSGKYLKRAIKKHGLENFTKEVLHIFSSEEEMRSKEAELVNEEFVARDDTYNLCHGGKGGFGYINATRDHIKHNRKIASIRDYSETRTTSERSRRSSMAKNLQDDGKIYKFKGGEFSGRIHKESTRLKIGTANSKHQMGIKNSQYGTMWVTNGSVNLKIKNDKPIPMGFKKGRIRSKVFKVTNPCPKCSTELILTNPDVDLLCNPPRKQVNCSKCDYIGSL